MKKLCLITLVLMSGLPAMANNKAELLKMRDAVVAQREAKLKTYVEDHLPQWILKYENELRAYAQGGSYIETEVFFEGDQQKKLVPGFTKHFVDEGWIVEVNKEHSGADWIVLELHE